MSAYIVRCVDRVGVLDTAYVGPFEDHDAAVAYADLCDAHHAGEADFFIEVLHAVGLGVI